MSIAPVRQRVAVRVPPERAFAVFAGDIGRWWPRQFSIGTTPMADVVMEPRSGGRWFQRGEDSSETEWGRVLAWEPPTRLLLAWQIDAGWRFDPALVTEVELRFTPDGSGTLVTLEHRNLERFGDRAAHMAERVNGGWPCVLRAYTDRAGPAEPATHLSEENVR